MKKTILLKSAILSTIFLTSTIINSQAQIFIQASNNANLSISGYVNPIGVVIKNTVGTATDPCAWGYNYDLSIEYAIIPNDPSIVVYEASTRITCGNNQFSAHNWGHPGWQPKPLSGIDTTVNNQWRSTNDCGTATFASLGCLVNQPTIRISAGLQGGTGNIISVQDQAFSFSNGSNTPLALDLVSFNGRQYNNKVVLDWSVAKEDVKHDFVLEKSSDLKNWEPVYSTKEIKTKYQYIDNSPLSGVNYYRLLQTSIDGKKSYSITLAVKSEVASSNFKLFPNPSNGENVFVNGLETNEKWSLNIVDVTGKTIKSVDKVNNQAIQLNNAPSGLYYFIFTNTEVGTTQTVLFQKN